MEKYLFIKCFCSVFYKKWHSEKRGCLTKMKQAIISSYTLETTCGQDEK